jgi:hypothetical protein
VRTRPRGGQPAPVPDRLDVVAENARIASHARSFERSQTFYDWRHYVA